MKNIAYYSVKTASMLLTIFLLVVCLFCGFLYFCSLVKMEVPTLGPFQVYVVISPSMEPKLMIGDAVIIRKTDPAKLNPGDIITFTAFESNIVNTHRITDKELTADGYEFWTKGDNSAADTYTTPQSRIIGKYFLHIPKMGPFLDISKQRPYLIVAAVVLILLLQFFFGVAEKKFKPAAEETVATPVTVAAEGPQLAPEQQPALEQPPLAEQQTAERAEAEQGAQKIQGVFK